MRTAQTRTTVVALLAVVVLLALPLPASVRIKGGFADNVAPFQNGFALLSQVLRGLPARARGLRQAAAERQEMLMAQANLRLDIQDLEHLRHENEALRRSLGYARESGARKLLFCRVIGRDGAGGWWMSVRLSRGRRDGVVAEMAALTPEGLVGMVTNVSERTCDVRLITDERSRIPCRVLETGTFGVLKGMGESGRGEGQLALLHPAKSCDLDYLPLNAALRVGYEVVTSDVGGILPADLRVGRIGGLRADSSGLYLRANVVPAAQLGSLRYVFVLLEPPRREGGSP